MGEARSTGRKGLVFYAWGTKASLHSPRRACSLVCLPRSGPTLMPWPPYFLFLLHGSLHLSSLIPYPGLLYPWVPKGWRGLCSCLSPCLSRGGEQRLMLISLSYGGQRAKATA